MFTLYGSKKACKHLRLKRVCYCKHYSISKEYSVSIPDQVVSPSFYFSRLDHEISTTVGAASPQVSIL